MHDIYYNFALGVLDSSFLAQLFQNCLLFQLKGSRRNFNNNNRFRKKNSHTRKSLFNNI